MASVDTAYGSVTGVTVTLASLTDTSSRESTAWNATTGNVVDMLVRAKTNGQASGTDYMYVHVYGSLETASQIYTDGATGSDAAFTTANLLNSPLLGAIKMNAATSVTGGPWSVASAWGGFVPPYIGLIFRNESGATLSATGGDHDVDYLPVYVTSA